MTQCTRCAFAKESVAHNTGLCDVIGFSEVDTPGSLPLPQNGSHAGSARCGSVTLVGTVAVGGRTVARQTLSGGMIAANCVIAMGARATMDGRGMASAIADPLDTGFRVTTARPKCGLY